MSLLLFLYPPFALCRDLSEAASAKDRSGAIHDVRFSSDGRLLAVCTSDGALDLYDPSALAAAGAAGAAGANGGKLKRIGECVPSALSPAGGDQQQQQAAALVPANPHNRFLCHVDFSADCKAVQVNNGASDRFVFRVPCIRSCVRTEKFLNQHTILLSGCSLRI